MAQIGSPEELYQRPKTAFVARFLGLTNIFHGRVLSEGGQSWLGTPLGRFAWPDAGEEGSVGVLLRPERVQFGQGGGHVLQGHLVSRRFQGIITRAEVEASGQRLRLEFPARAQLPAVGERLSFSFEPQEALQILNDEND